MRVRDEYTTRPDVGDTETDYLYDTVEVMRRMRQVRSGESKGDQKYQLIIITLLFRHRLLRAHQYVLYHTTTYSIG